MKKENPTTKSDLPQSGVFFMGSGSPLCLLGFGQCRKYYHKEHLFLLLLLEPQMWGGYRCYMHLCPGIQTAFILQRSHFHTLKTTTKGRETPL